MGFSFSGQQGNMLETMTIDNIVEALGDQNLCKRNTHKDSGRNIKSSHQMAMCIVSWHYSYGVGGVECPVYIQSEWYDSSSILETGALVTTT